MTRQELVLTWIIGALAALSVLCSSWAIAHIRF